ncbi:sphingoid long-chain base transporter Rsb1p [[Candida] jaroonii]|uniref:Sphingoid long-chain base transporter Rsb1p n=1 Tax=[Candida] jaroonii TaxID=467808 RepID=A0ACA9YD86_9ASCO|nr:sphingoid long-chain base transporter Rsb1p [[Candida] jaroonii]
MSITTDAWTSVNPTAITGIQSTITSAMADLSQTGGDYRQYLTASYALIGAQASKNVLSYQSVLATATDSSVISMASQGIAENAVALEKLDMTLNLYKYDLNRPANIIYFTVFALIFIYTVGMSVVSRYHWYNVTYICGYGLEFLGWLGRILAMNNVRNNNYYILQFVALTIAPAFIMAGIYFLFAQLVVVHGRAYSILRPLWYSYLFITCDVVSLLIQAGGGASASIASSRNEDTTTGSNIIIAGIVFQTVAMTVFLGFYFEFLNRLFFKHRNETESTSPLKKRSFGSFFKLLFNTKSARAFKKENDVFYNEKFAHIRSNPLFGYMPLAITVSVVVIYIRCVYRVVELAEGWRGHLITTEVYIMVLDALMIAIAGIIAVPFHPYWVFGKANVVKLATIRKNLDVHDDSSTKEEPSSGQ